MPLSSLWGVIVGVAVVAIGLYHAVFVGPKLRAISGILRGEGDPADAESLALLRNAQTVFARKTEDRLDVLERCVGKDVYKIGFLRYNSFDDVGSDLSYTLAMLNDDGDGVVLTSIYSREDTRTYGKAVRKFVPQQGASKEEQTAISLARSGGGGVVVGGES